jgi:DHA1 family tetracycline resistance protein-like MFS transporter
MFGAAPSRRRAALAFIFVTVTLDMLAIGVIVPVLPKLVVEFVGGDTARGAQLVGLFGTVWALMQFLWSPLLGALSDRFGRRPVILLSNLGLGLDYILMALAPNLAWLLAARILSGITAASISTAGAYIADVTPPEKRAAGFGLLGAAFGLGFVIGPAMGGLLGSIDLRLPFWAAAALSLANALYGLLILPESLPREKRSPIRWSRANPMGSIALLRSYRGLTRFAVIGFLNRLAHDALPSVFVLYASFRYGWDERTIGLTLAGVGVSSAVVQAGMVRRAVSRFGEHRILLAGLAFGVAGFALYGYAGEAILFWIGVPIVALWGLSGPSLQALMTGRVGPTEQGQLQGAQQSLGGIAGMIGPALFGYVFAFFISGSAPAEIPGAAFYLSAAMLVAASATALLGERR